MLMGSRRTKWILAVLQLKPGTREGREHVSVDWLIRLMGCWHFSPRTVEAPEAAWAGRESSQIPWDKQGSWLFFAWMAALCADVQCTSISFYGWISGFIMMWFDQKWRMDQCHLQKSCHSHIDCRRMKLMKLKYSSEIRMTPGKTIN